MKKVEKAGALLEVLVIVFVAVIAAPLILPTFSRTSCGARHAYCLNNLKQIITAIKTYSPDYDEYYPTSAEPNQSIDVSTHYKELGILYPTYVTSLDVFCCSSSGDRMPRRYTSAYDNRPLLTREARQMSYAYSYDGSSGKNLPWTEAAPSTTRILADRHASKRLTRHSNHKMDGRNVAFADGHVKWVSGTRKLLTDPDNPDPKVNDKCWWSET
jgi:prepilin-type processing-associated H-X9-DG protein